jgi:hypothetical protein
LKKKKKNKEILIYKLNKALATFCYLFFEFIIGRGKKIQINYKFLGNQYVIHGHTPQSKNDTLIQLKNIETTRMVNIDNGCVFKDFSDLGRLTALQIGINKLTSIQNSD